jgi:ribosomal protein S18 acetylase RimI-like enzyme
MTSVTPVVVRLARPEECAAIGELTVAAYVADGLAGPSYAERLRDATSRAADGALLVATGSSQGRAHSEDLLGTVGLFAAGAEYAQLAGPGEMEIRMLAVHPATRGRGVGAALAAACVQRALDAGAAGIRLSTDRRMTTAHRIYERLGFRRTPDRDWSPVPDSTLLSYALELGGGASFCDRCGGRLDAGTHAECSVHRRLEPPRYCVRCRRRLVVQVTPHGWTARCARHGERSGHESDLA